MNKRNPAELPRTLAHRLDYIDIEAHVREAVLLRNAAVAELLVSAWHATCHRLASFAALVGRVTAVRRSGNACHRPSAPAPHH